MNRKQFLIVGVGRFGAAMAQTLSNMNHEVVAIDNDEAVLDEIADKVTHAAIVDATSENALAKLDIPSFDSVIIAIGQNLEASILATLAAKSAGARHLVSKADTALTAKVLASVGADEVVRPEHDMGIRLARQLATPAIIHALDLGPDHRVIEIETSGVKGRLANLGLPKRFGVQVIAVRRDERLHVGPGADFVVQPGDRMVVIGAHDDFPAFHDHVSG